MLPFSQFPGPSWSDAKVFNKPAIHSEAQHPVCLAVRLVHGLIAGFLLMAQAYSLRIVHPTLRSRSFPHPRSLIHTMYMSSWTSECPSTQIPSCQSVPTPAWSILWCLWKTKGNQNHKVQQPLRAKGLLVSPMWASGTCLKYHLQQLQVTALKVVTPHWEQSRMLARFSPRPPASPETANSNQSSTWSWFWQAVAFMINNYLLNQLWPL